MQELNELKNLVIQSLEANGSLSNIRAQIRASVFKVIDQQDPPAQQPKKPSAFSWENPKCAALLQNPNGTLILQLIKEFLQFYGMDYSNSVFSSEGNIREEVKRDKINGVLKIKELDAKKPILLQVLEEFSKKNNSSEIVNNQEGKEKDLLFSASASPTVDVQKVEKQPEVKEQVNIKPTEIEAVPKQQQNKSEQIQEVQSEESQLKQQQKQQQQQLPEKSVEILQQNIKASDSNDKVKTGESEKNDSEIESARGKKALEAVEKFIQKNQDQLKSGEIASLSVTGKDQGDKQVESASDKSSEQKQGQFQQQIPIQEKDKQTLQGNQLESQEQQQKGLKYDSEEFDQYEEEGVEEQLEQYQDEDEYNEEDYQHGHYASDTHEKASNVEESEDFIGQSSKGHDISVDSYELENFDYITDVEDL